MTLGEKWYDECLRKIIRKQHNTVYGKVSDMTDYNRYYLSKVFDTIIYDEVTPPDNYLNKYIGVWQIDRIHKIIQSGPCTILIPTWGGDKTIVRNQDEDTPLDSRIGFLTVLIKYLFDKKIYTDLIERIFEGRDLNNDFDRRLIVSECEIVLISKLGDNIFYELATKFYNEYGVVV